MKVKACESRILLFIIRIIQRFTEASLNKRSILSTEKWLCFLWLLPVELSYHDRKKHITSWPSDVIQVKVRKKMIPADEPQLTKLQKRIRAGIWKVRIRISSKPGFSCFFSAISLILAHLGNSFLKLMIFRIIKQGLTYPVDKENL